MKFPRLVILDRDGVINREQGHITHVGDFEILEGVCESIAKLNSEGCLVCVASNQSGLARGILSEQSLLEIQAFFEEKLSRVGGKISHWFYSPWHPDMELEGGIQKWLGEHEDRKPSTGMLNKALIASQVEVADAVMVGDSRKDADAARTLGIEFLGVKSAKANELDGESVFASLEEIVNYLLRRANKSKNSANQSKV